MSMEGASTFSLMDVDSAPVAAKKMALVHSQTIIIVLRKCSSLNHYIPTITEEEYA